MNKSQSYFYTHSRLHGIANVLAMGVGLAESSMQTACKGMSLQRLDAMQQLKRAMADSGQVSCVDCHETSDATGQMNMPA